MPQKNFKTQVSDREQQLKNNTSTAALVVGLFMTVVVGLALYTLRAEEINKLFPSVFPFLIGIIAYFSAFISRRGRHRAAAYLLLGTILLVSLASAFLFSKGQGIALAVIVLVITSFIAQLTLPSNQAGVAVALAVMIGLIDILADYYLPDPGIRNIPAYTNAIAAFLAAIFLINIFRQFNQFTLRIKLGAIFVLITLITAISLGVYTNTTERATLINQATNDLLETARFAGDSIDVILDYELRTIYSEAQNLDFVDYLNTPRNQRAGSPEEQRALTDLLNMKRKNDIYISSYAIIDRNGINILDTFAEDINTLQSNQDYFQIPVETGLVYISPILITPVTLDPVIYLAAPIRNSDGEIIGVLRSRINAAFLQTLLAQFTDTEHESEFAEIVDAETLTRLANTSSSENLYKTYENLPPAQIGELQVALRLKPGLFQDTTTAEDEMTANLRNPAQQNIFTAATVAYNGGTGYFASHRMSKANWIILIGRSEEAIFQPIREQTQQITLITMGVIIFAVFLSIVASQSLVRPVVELSNIARSIAGGNRDIRAEISTGDEVGALSEAFNVMTDELSATLNTLENRVAERTAELETSRAQVEKRAIELQFISEISKIISSEQRIETLLPLITRLVSERFGFYHVGVFLLDETGQYAVLRAANSEGGKRMLNRSHKLEVGGNSIVGYVTRRAVPRIALDVGADAVFFNNPDLPNTRSEMALPLIARNRLIGALDVQSESSNAFTETDANTLSILADQAAIAIENTRLFEQSQETLRETQALYRQNIAEGWRLFSQEEPIIGYEQTLTGGRKIERPVDSEEIRRAINQGNIIVSRNGQSQDQPFMVVPIKLRGQTIGTLRVQAGTRKQEWTNDEINLAKVISERLSLALENARLIQESQRQLIKEQTISTVSERISASIDLRNVLQTAVEELGRAMPGSEVIIRLDSQKDGAS